jgi:hypothetical protein
VEREYVSSSDISSVGYDRETATLEIEFNNGGVYQYDGVPEVVHGALMGAASKGKYFHTNIKGHYPFRRV